METIDERNFKQKFQRTVYDVKENVKKAGQWILDNPQSVATLGAGMLMLAKGAKSISRTYNDMQRIDTEKRRIWDPQMGQALYVKRPMNGAEKLEFERRVKDGQGRADALADMNLLDKRR